MKNTSDINGLSLRTPITIAVCVYVLVITAGYANADAWPMDKDFGEDRYLYHCINRGKSTGGVDPVDEYYCLSERQTGQVIRVPDGTGGYFLYTKDSGPMGPFRSPKEVCAAARGNNVTLGGPGGSLIICGSAPRGDQSDGNATSGSHATGERQGGAGAPMPFISSLSWNEMAPFVVFGGIALLTFLGWLFSPNQPVQAPGQGTTRATTPVRPSPSAPVQPPEGTRKIPEKKQQTVRPARPVQWPAAPPTQPIENALTYVGLVPEPQVSPNTEETPPGPSLLGVNPYVVADPAPPNNGGGNVEEDIAVVSGPRANRELVDAYRSRPDGVITDANGQKYVRYNPYNNYPGDIMGVVSNTIQVLDPATNTMVDVLDPQSLALTRRWTPPVETRQSQISPQPTANSLAVALSREGITPTLNLTAS